MIPVTKPFLPALDEYEVYLKGIWQRNWLTNNGPLVKELELKLTEFLGVQHLLYTNNGTIALQIAIKALGLKGEIITTPFSYVATASSIVWEGCTPVFVDIDPKTLNIDSSLIEAAITPLTSGIIATHVFGNACDIDAIDLIAQNHGLKVIYDAAHCFGSMYKEKSVFAFGDISTTSFHATKLFHTIEGGAVFTNSAKLLKDMTYLRNFGHDGPERFNGIGINGKNSEFHAAMGLCNIKHVESILARRAVQFRYYDEILEKLLVMRTSIQAGCQFNYSYYPIIFETEQLALNAKMALEKEKIYPRRYFYPSLSKLNYVPNSKTPISEAISSSILCLPLYHDLTMTEQRLVGRVLLGAQY